MSVSFPITLKHKKVKMQNPLVMLKNVALFLNGTINIKMGPAHVKTT